VFWARLPVDERVRDDAVHGERVLRAAGAVHLKPPSTSPWLTDGASKAIDWKNAPSAGGRTLRLTLWPMSVLRVSTSGVASPTT
jgi:hypothetical protein